MQNADGNTPLHFACRAENEITSRQLVAALLKHSVNVNVSNRHGWTPLHVSCQNAILLSCASAATQPGGFTFGVVAGGASATAKNATPEVTPDIPIGYPQMPQRV